MKFRMSSKGEIFTMDSMEKPSPVSKKDLIVGHTYYVLVYWYNPAMYLGGAMSRCQTSKTPPHREYVDLQIEEAIYLRDNIFLIPNDKSKYINKEYKIAYEDIFINKEDADYGFEYAYWEEYFYINVIKYESKFLQSLGWDEKESKSRKGKYKMCKETLSKIKIMRRELNKKMREFMNKQEFVNNQEFIKIEDLNLNEYERILSKKNELNELCTVYLNKLDNIVSKQNMTVKETRFWQDLEQYKRNKAKARREKRRQLKSQNSFPDEK